MKNTIFIFITILSLVFVSCKKDACEGVTCYNGGECKDGVCDCKNGYTGAQCQTPPQTEPLPKASFSTENGGCTAICRVYFINSSENAEEYYWDFGDGSVSNSEDASNLYVSAGTYTVKLKAINSTGYDYASKTITIR